MLLFKLYFCLLYFLLIICYFAYIIKEKVFLHFMKFCVCRMNRTQNIAVAISCVHRSTIICISKVLISNLLLVVVLKRSVEQFLFLVNKLRKVVDCAFAYMSAHLKTLSSLYIKVYDCSHRLWNTKVSFSFSEGQYSRFCVSIQSIITISKLFIV